MRGNTKAAASGKQSRCYRFWAADNRSWFDSEAEAPVTERARTEKHQEDGRGPRDGSPPQDAICNSCNLLKVGWKRQITLGARSSLCFPDHPNSLHPPSVPWCTNINQRTALGVLFSLSLTCSDNQTQTVIVIPWSILPVPTQKFHVWNLQTSHLPVEIPGIPCDIHNSMGVKHSLKIAQEVCVSQDSLGKQKQWHTQNDLKT